MGPIAQAAGLADRGATSRYLETLREMRVLERRTPVTERNPERTRRGRYRLTEVRFSLWSRSGFTAGMKRLAKQDGVLLCDLAAVSGSG